MKKALLCFIPLTFAQLVVPRASYADISGRVFYNGNVPVLRLTNSSPYAVKCSFEIDYSAKYGAQGGVERGSACNNEGYYCG